MMTDPAPVTIDVTAEPEEGVIEVVPDEETAPIESERYERMIHNREVIDNAYWELSQDLYEIFHSSEYKEWGFDTYTAFCEEGLGFTLRKAERLKGIYEYFSKMRPEVRDWVKSLGWSKANLLVRVMDERNFNRFKRDLDGASVREIQEYVKNVKAQQSGKMLEDADGDSDDTKKKSGSDGKAKTMSFKFYPDQRENVLKAVDHAKKAAGTDSDSAALDLVATQYLSTSVGMDDFHDLLKRVQAQVGYHITAFDDDGLVVFGNDSLEKIFADEVDDPDEDIF